MRSLQIKADDLEKLNGELEEGKFNLPGFNGSDGKLSIGVRPSVFNRESTFQALNSRSSVFDMIKNNNRNSRVSHNRGTISRISTA